MLSLFSELSHTFTRSSNYNTPSKLFFDPSSGISRLRDINFVNMFNYEQQLRSYGRVFGFDNVKVILYEQLKHDPSGFSTSLSSILNYKNTSLVHECLQSQLNTKVIYNGEYRSSASPLLSLFGERIGRRLLKSSRTLNSHLKNILIILYH